MDQNTRNRLLESIHADRLVVLCGAGLSMAPPSNLPSAWSIANECHDRYCQTVDPDLDLRPGNSSGHSHYSLLLEQDYVVICGLRIDEMMRIAKGTAFAIEKNLDLTEIGGEIVSGVGRSDPPQLFNHAV